MSGHAELIFKILFFLYSYHIPSPLSAGFKIQLNGTTTSYIKQSETGLRYVFLAAEVK